MRVVGVEQVLTTNLMRLLDSADNLVGLMSLAQIRWRLPEIASQTHLLKDAAS